MSIIIQIAEQIKQDTGWDYEVKDYGVLFNVDLTHEDYLKWKQNAQENRKQIKGTCKENAFKG